MANPQIGSIKWAQVSGGSLRKNERLRLLAQAILLRLVGMSARGLRKTGLSRAEAARIDLDSIRVPDSKAARDAFELCSETSPTFLVNHCMRTYLWGALLARHNRLQHDEELLYVASLLHDLGLTEACRQNGSGNCFAAHGAQVAQRFSQTHQWPEVRQHALADAICLHLNPRVPKTQGMEAHLLHEGASLDVIGARFNEIHLRTRVEVLERHPRTGFKDGMRSLMKAEAKFRTESRAGFLVGLGLNRMIRAAPFDD